MKHRPLFARPGLVLFFGAIVTSCSGGGGATADTQPPAASHAQVQQMIAQPADVTDPSDSISGSQQDTGTLLPLSVLSPRTTSGTVTPMSITSCASTAACTGGTNTSTGPGVAGVSSLGKGVTGTTKFASTSSTNGQFGVYGQDSSTSGTFDIGVYGLSVRGIGVSGKSSSNYGVRGTSTSNFGVVGQGSRGVYGTGPIGVYGTGTSRGVSGNVTATGATGVYGASPAYIAVYGTGAYGLYGIGTNYGVLGTTTNGYGGYFSSSSFYGVRAASGSSTAIYAGSSSGFAIEGHTGGHVGAYITNSLGNGADIEGSYIGLVARAPASGYPLTLTDSSGNNVFFVTGNGDVYYHGGLHTFAATSTGAQALAFSPQTTRAQIQDTGTGHLVNGHAMVMLDSTFARTIDPRQTYQVFLTPDGDTRGLYVASKTPSQFVVREVQGGHGTFSFDYQITAVAVGKAAQRMTMVQPNARLLPPPTRDTPAQVQRPKE